MHNTILSAAGALIRDEQGRILLRLHPEELTSAAFLPPDEAFGRLIPRLERRMRAAVLAQEKRRPVYPEHEVAHSG